MREALLLAVALASPACVIDNPAVENPSPVAAESFRDIPSPGGFRLVTDGREGSKYENGEFKQGLLKYEGIGRAQELATFFQNQMPVAGWQPEASAPDRASVQEAETMVPSDLGERRDLFFSKGRYLAQIIVGETGETTDSGPKSLIIVAVKTK